jgi:prepilin-type N-terminal cleavage/methylation domain-containing protein
MAQPVKFNKKGVTLIEMMISLLILMVVSLALMQTTLVGMNANQTNLVRDEAVSVAEMRMNQLKSLRFTDTVVDTDLIGSAPPGVTTLEADVPRTINRFSLNYKPTRTITDVSADSKQITIKIDWKYKNKDYTHSVISIMRKQQ